MGHIHGAYTWATQDMGLAYGGMGARGMGYARVQGHIINMHY
jgi:hypothetical protein